MKTLENKLIEAIKINSIKKEGIISTSLIDKVTYRYDHYYFNYESALNWMVKTFNKLAGTENTIQIGNYSIRYDRPEYKGGRNGKFYMKELIEFNK